MLDQMTDDDARAMARLLKAAGTTEVTQNADTAYTHTHTLPTLFDADHYRTRLDALLAAVYAEPDDVRERIMERMQTAKRNT